MGGVKQLAGFTTAIAVGLTVGACGGSSGAKSRATAVPATSSAAHGPKPTPASPTSPAPAAPPAPTMSPSLAAKSLLLGMLPASAFGPSLKYDAGSPSSLGSGPGDTAAVTGSTDCTQLDQGGASPAGVAAASASGSAQTSSAVIRGFYERAEQYGSGGAAVVLASMIDQAGTNCATFAMKLDDGTKVPSTMKVTAVSGLGQQAAMFEHYGTLPQGAVVYETLTVRYGDVLVTAGCTTRTVAQAHTCKLDAKVKKIALLLKIS